MTNKTLEVTIMAADQQKLAAVDDVVKAVVGLKIDTDEQFKNAGEFLGQIKASAKEIEGARVSITRPLDEAKKAVMDLFRSPLEKLEGARRTIEGGLKDFQRKRDDELRLAQQKAIEAAKAEEERKIKALQAQAEKAIAAGKEEKAEALLDRAEAVHVPVIVPVIAAPKISGMSFRSTYKAKILDIGAIPPDYYLSDPKVQVAIQSTLDGLARATRCGIKVSGVEFYEEKTPVSR